MVRLNTLHYHSNNLFILAAYTIQIDSFLYLSFKSYSTCNIVYSVHTETCVTDRHRITRWSILMAKRNKIKIHDTKIESGNCWNYNQFLSTSHQPKGEGKKEKETKQCT